jgi:hypothetical protein
MYTMCTEWYIDQAVFREAWFWLVPSTVDSPCTWDDKAPRARIFHQCPVLGHRAGAKVGIIFHQYDAENMKCDKCHKRPGADISTLYTLLREA